jgi:hypothetical protein
MSMLQRAMIVWNLTPPLVYFSGRLMVSHRMLRGSFIGMNQEH